MVSSTSPKSGQGCWGPFKRCWIWIDLDIPTFCKMLKGALPPTMVLAMYQANAISNIMGNFGYLAAIVVISSQCLQPRAKYLKIMFFCLLSTCSAAALACLVMYSSIKARQNTTPSDASPEIAEGYNSSACAVAGLWFIVAIWFSNTLRATRAMELQDPMTLFSIFCVITHTQAPRILTISEGIAFVDQLLKTFMIGFALATGISLLIYPMTSRRNFFKGVNRYAAAVQIVLQAQIAYLKTIDDVKNGKVERVAKPGQGRDALALKDATNRVRGLLDSLHGDLIYAKQEIACGKLSARELKTLFGHLRSMLFAVSGMSMLPDALGAIVRQSDLLASGPRDTAKAGWEMWIWEQMALPLMGRLQLTLELVELGFQHVLIRLELHYTSSTTRTKKDASDLEASSSNLVPGSNDFEARFKGRLDKFQLDGQSLLNQWIEEMQAASKKGQHQFQLEDEEPFDGLPQLKGEIFIVLFMEHLQSTLLHLVHVLVRFTDATIITGKMKKSQLVLPKSKYLKAWLSADFWRRTLSREPLEGNENSEIGAKHPHIEQIPPDPEHLPPANIVQKFGDKLRAVSNWISSTNSLFGFRVSAASFTIAILAFLRQSQAFFVEQRLIWGIIVIVIGMSPTSGASLFGFIGRIVSTTIALILGLLVWYIANGKIPGVIAMLYIANLFEFYFYCKFPRLLGPCMISIVTLNVIVGYQLQISQLGVVAGTSDGQPYFPIYLFGPYKLLTVIAGCFVSFIWTIFPYPVSAGSQMRQMLGHSLFVLANFYSCMHTTINVWMNEEQGDIRDKKSPAAQLEMARNILFSKQMSLLTALRALSNFASFEPPVGGAFPRSTYNTIISEIQSVTISMGLMSQATRSLEFPPINTQLFIKLGPSQSPPDDEIAAQQSPAAMQEQEKWLHRLARLTNDATDFQPHIITSLLCQLSASISSASSLPPYLNPPPSFPLARRLEKMDESVMDIRNAVEDPAFAAFATIEVLGSMVNRSMKSLVDDVKELVGEVKFDDLAGLGINRKSKGHLEKGKQKNV